MPPREPTLDEELEQLSPEQQAWARADLALRERASAMAARLGLDPGDVYHQLKQLKRSPSERLRVGLAQGRLRRRITE
jgi:aconitase B